MSAEVIDAGPSARQDTPPEVMGVGGANTGPPTIVGPLVGGASSVTAMASGPIRVYLNSANAARGSRSSAWNCASIGTASSARPRRCRAWNAP